MQLWKCFTVLTLRSACLAKHQTKMKTKAQQYQRACKTRWLSSEATVRARSEILAICTALNQLSQNQNDAMCVVLLRLMKTKISTCCFPFVNVGTSPDRTEQSFQAGCFSFAQMKTSVELCISKLSDAELNPSFKPIAKVWYWISGTQNAVWFGWLVCVKWYGVLSGHRKIGKLTIRIHKKGDRSEWTNYCGIPA